MTIGQGGAFNIEHGHESEAVGDDLASRDAPEMAGFGRGAVEFGMRVMICAHDDASSFAVVCVSGVSSIVDGGAFSGFGPGEDISSAFDAGPVDTAALEAGDVNAERALGE